MKRSLFSFFVLCALFSCTSTACSKKDSTDKPGGGDYGNHPRSKVPEELVGKYLQAGSFSMSQYSNYDGSYAGQAFEIATGYKFVNAKGDAEQYFYYTNTGYYCRDQILGFRKGTVVFDTENKTFKFYAASGNYRRYDACGSSQTPGYGQKKEYGAEDLYPKYTDEYDNYTILEVNGKTVWRIRLEDDTNLDFTATDSPE